MSQRFLFEHKKQPLLAYPQFLKRMLTSVFFSTALLSTTIILGMGAYHYLEGQTWIDSLVNAVTIMSGLGLQSELKTFPGKLFTVFFRRVIFRVFFCLKVQLLGERERRREVCVFVTQ